MPDAIENVARNSRASIRSLSSVSNALNASSASASMRSFGISSSVPNSPTISWNSCVVGVLISSPSYCFLSVPGN
jgi:hypothetical protein